MLSCDVPFANLSSYKFNLRKYFLFKLDLRLKGKISCNACLHTINACVCVFLNHTTNE